MEALITGGCLVGCLGATTKSLQKESNICAKPPCSAQRDFRTLVWWEYCFHNECLGGDEAVLVHYALGIRLLQGNRPKLDELYCRVSGLLVAQVIHSEGAM